MSDRVQVIEVVVTELLRRGKGTSTDPCHVVRQFWSKGGDLLAEVPLGAEGSVRYGDPFKERS